MPKEVRRNLAIKPGARMVVLQRKGIIELIPVGSIREAKGIAEGIETTGLREKHERFD